MSIQLKPIIAALGLALATLSGSAAAAVTLYSPVTTFEDDNVDFLVKGEGNTGGLGLLEVGDTLVTMIEISKTTAGANESLIAPMELSGITAITLHGFANIDGLGGANDMVFRPFMGGLNTFLDPTRHVASGGAGMGAMAALWLAPTANLTTTGSTNCANMLDCIDRATDGTLYEVDGFTGTKGDDTVVGETADDGWIHTDKDEYWFALNAETNTGLVLASGETSKFGIFNFGLSILEDPLNLFLSPGLTCLGLEATFCALYEGAGGDNQIDLLGSGDVLGGATLNAGVTADGAFAHSDFDFRKGVPEPATLALLGVGLLGMGASLRRRVR